MQTKERGTHDTGDGDNMIKQGQYWTPTFFGFRLGIPISCRPAAGAPSIILKVRAKPNTACCIYQSTAHTIHKRAHDQSSSDLCPHDKRRYWLWSTRYTKYTCRQFGFCLAGKSLSPPLLQVRAKPKTACWIYPYRSHNSGKRAYDQSSYDLCPHDRDNTMVYQIYS